MFQTVICVGRTDFIIEKLLWVQMDRKEGNGTNEQEQQRRSHSDHVEDKEESS